MWNWYLEHRLGQEGIDDPVEEGDEEEDEQGIDDLHLVGLDGARPHGAVHPRGLDFERKQNIVKIVSGWWIGLTNYLK